MSETRDLLIRGGTVVPMTEPRRWFSADVLVRDGRIAAVGDIAPDGAVPVLDASGALVLPGFVQCHVHVVQSLARHRADGLDLLDWLTTRIWPYEAELEADETRAAAELGIGELLAGGTTSVLDMGSVHHQDEIFAAAAALGIRLASGKCHMDTGDLVPPRLIEDPDRSLADAETLGARWHGSHRGRLRYAVAPRFVLSCSEPLLEGSAALARRNGWLLHTHASENPRETELVREITGRSNVAYLADMGLAGRDTVLAHCVHLDDADFDALVAAETAVAHCPGANLKLASGIADLPRMLSRGVRVGIGADGPPCNNRLSAFHEMALAGTVHTLRHGAAAVDPWTALELATWRGAEAIGLDETGRIVPGWAADLAVVDTDRWSMAPFADPAAMMVFGGEAGSVRHVVVDGRIVVRSGRLENGDANAIRTRATAAAGAIAGRLEWS